ncbi:hypothetical protein TNIN_272991 [Trichonephila inaurata madagascariensis]|uniref:Uncharacterized protein n=1 Tax=Trichonephila inaurata madagascariensis TaxID=2747483 RepID=A0A8X7CFD0_9ARAC|nr:hypothetical protein TNIN_369261 [Trichonephila inaurata madagascariensis]GFY64401.1 hypothetical protein TNIN_272991 [Trichonephila inaurata madagascariensis]
MAVGFSCYTDSPCFGIICNIAYCLNSRKLNAKFSAVTTKSGEFNELSVFSNHSESDKIGPENQASKFENPKVVQKSSKRSLRRKRLREMSKTTLQFF